MSQYGTQLTTLGAAGGGDLQAAAEVVADGAREIAGRWSASIPERIKVTVSGSTATISCDAPPAWPAETQARHPLFAQGPKGSGGGWDHWYGPPGPPFLGPALDQRADPAMARYAQKIDAMCRRAGFN